MSKLKLDLDIDLVQATVKSQVEPAVKEALAKHDVKMLIVKALEKPTAQDDYLYMPMYYGRHSKPEPLLDAMVRQAVSDAAKAFVAKAMKANAEMVESAFQKMMANSSSKVVKAFSDAMVNGIKGEWGFALDVKVAPTVPERERDYE